MTWGAVELEPEVEKWLESLPTALFARAAFYVDLLARCIDEAHRLVEEEG
ncbi:hypothetical protein ACFFMR_23720 [Micromonospora andamanensis]|uniref:Uncharacterized protein n=1 Tax=Micromonospora andamanensis TaxID=1287068 RepID=A0ABQ4HU51_9ACTN|nr:hypothetical protein [Micromonospora andamanensis]GIJ09189.1 hypothetical protein Van01_24030 [Micromonospora andamanensis]GIJ37378.1 hypothetical protein Vwe01_07030 [Micromonospora andamanensis]